MQNEPVRYLTPPQTAELLGVTVGTLEVWRCTKRYPLPYVKVGKRVRYRTTDIDQFLASRTVTCGAK